MSELPQGITKKAFKRCYDLVKMFLQRDPGRIELATTKAGKKIYVKLTTAHAIEYEEKKGDDVVKIYRHEFGPGTVMWYEIKDEILMIKGPFIITEHGIEG